MTLDETGRDRPYPQVTYCTPDDVADVMGLPMEGDVYGVYRPNDMTTPSYEQVCRMIQATEGEIDGRTRRTWRAIQEKDVVKSLPTYEWDSNGIRQMHFARGGEYVQLKRNILPWDPEKGDKLEIRTRLNGWADASDPKYTKFGKSAMAFWFDYPRGRLFFARSMFTSPYNSMRITYRHGSEDAVPEEVRRLCALLVATKLINMQAFSVKVGLGGDLSGMRDAMLKGWQDEINSLYTGLQRSGSVHSLYG